MDKESSGALAQAVPRLSASASIYPQSWHITNSSGPIFNRPRAYYLTLKIAISSSNGDNNSRHLIIAYLEELIMYKVFSTP